MTRLGRFSRCSALLWQGDVNRHTVIRVDQPVKSEAWDTSPTFEQGRVSVLTKQEHGCLVDVIVEPNVFGIDGRRFNRVSTYMPYGHSGHLFRSHRDNRGKYRGYEDEGEIG